MQDSKDVLVFAEIMLEYEYCERFFRNDILLCFKGITVKKELILGLLSSIYKSYKEDHTLSKKTTKPVHRDTIRSLKPELFEVGDIEANSKRIKYEPPTSYTYYGARPVASVPNNSTPSEIADFVGRCLDLGLQKEAHGILRDVVKKCPLWLVKAFGSI